MSDTIALVALIVAVLGSILTWVVRVERKLASISTNIAFLKEHILKWNRREPAE